MIDSCGSCSGNHTPEQIERLRQVHVLSQELVAAVDRGVDVSPVIAQLDPDPLRYAFVTEGAEHLPTFLSNARRTLKECTEIAGAGHLEPTELLTDSPRYEPSVAVGAAGLVVMTYLQTVPGVGDRVMASVSRDSGRSWSSEACLSGDPRDCLRPRVVISGAHVPSVVYSARVDDNFGVWCTSLVDCRWTRPRLISEPGRAAFNVEAVARRADNGIDCAWQELRNRRYHIVLRSRIDDEWLPVTAMSGTGPEGNAWDASVASGHDGRTLCVWSEYRDGAYHVFLRERSRSGVLSDTRQLTSGTDYAIHPSITATGNGRFFCAFDVVSYQGHGGSGTTRLIRREDIESPPPDGTLEHGMHVPRDLMLDVQCRLTVLEITDEGVYDWSSGLAEGQLISPAAMPSIVATDDGALVVAYRVLRRLPLISYYWDVVVQTLEPGGWTGPVLCGASDGPPLQPAIAGAGDDVMVAWQTDGRKARHVEWESGFGGRECPHLREHYGEVVWHGLVGPGQVMWGSLSAGSPVALPSETPTAELRYLRRTEARRWLADVPDERYSTNVHGESLQLYWGDLHRHSLISRCTIGDEPSPGDYYRYATDIFDYDFWALTEHAENTTAHQWWNLQKLADLFRHDDAHVPLYGFEWTSKKTGHMNVIYGETPRGAPIFSAYAEQSETPDQLWGQLDRWPDFPAVTIPHHPASAMTPFDFSYYSDKYLRLVEIFQACRGSYEVDGGFRQYRDAANIGHFTVDGLMKGHKYGFVGSSDHGTGAAYVGAFAPNLSRDAIFQSLAARRTIAATTKNVVIDMRVGELFMGEAGRLRGPVEVALEGQGYAPVARLELVQDGVAVRTLEPEPDLPRGWVQAHIRVDWSNKRPDETVDWSGSLSVEGKIACTEYISPEFTRMDDRTAAWQGVTPTFGEMFGAQRGQVELTVTGPPEAAVSVEAGAVTLTTTVGDLANGNVCAEDTNRGRLSVRPGTGGLTSLGTQRVAHSWELEITEPVWLYSRIILVDGEMAWSSPVWIE